MISILVLWFILGENAVRFIFPLNLLWSIAKKREKMREIWLIYFLNIYIYIYIFSPYIKSLFFCFLTRSQLRVLLYFILGYNRCILRHYSKYSQINSLAFLLVCLKLTVSFTFWDIYTPNFIIKNKLYS